MSSPNTDLHKQKRRHSAPLIGMVVATAVVVVVAIVLLFSGAEEATPPEGAEEQIDGRTGQPSEADDTAVPADAPNAEEPAPAD